MPNPTTHLAAMKELIKEKPELFRNINKKYFLSGTVFPDITYFIPCKKKNNLSLYWHRNKKATLEFANKLMKEAKTKKEKSFALGFLSHAIVDKLVHKELNRLKLFKANHILVEYFLDGHYEKQRSIESLAYPRKLIDKALIKEKRQDLAKHSGFGIIKKLEYKFSQIVVGNFVNAKYVNKSKKFYIFDPIVRFALKKDLFEYSIDPKLMIDPNFKFKKYVKPLLIAIEKSKKEFEKILKKTKI